MQFRFFLEAIIGNIYIFLGLSFLQCFCYTGDISCVSFFWRCSLESIRRTRPMQIKHIFSNSSLMHIERDYWIFFLSPCFKKALRICASKDPIDKLKQTSQRYCSVVINAMKNFRIFSVTNPFRRLAHL